MIHIILACIGSGGAGFSAVCSSEDRVISTGRMNRGSLADRSVIQPIQGALRISTLDSSTQYSAMNTDRKSTRLNSSHLVISYAVFCLKKKKIDLANECEKAHC